MLLTMDYRRDKALEYAYQWARGRNPKYYNFDKVGGDCTNFISQCIYAGCGVMNFTPIYGWFYHTSDHRTASWTGVEYLYRFLTRNEEAGPFAKEVPVHLLKEGDIIQLGNHTRFYHSLFVTHVGTIPKPSNILVATHTFDTLNRVLESYSYHRIRYLHIEGYRKWEKD